jgi:hypothetical protein
MERLEMSYSRKFAKEMFVDLIEKSGDLSSGDFGYFNPGDMSADGRKWDAIIDRLQPSERVEIGRKIVECMKQSEAPSVQCRLCYLLNALLPGIGGDDGKEQIRNAASVLAERLKVASELGLTQYALAIEILEPNIGPAEALSLGESILDAAPRIRANPLLHAAFAAYLAKLVRKLDQKAIQQFQKKVGTLLDPKRKLDDSDPVAVAKRELEILAGTANSRPFDGQSLRAILDQAKSSPEARLAIMAQAERLDPQELIRAIADTLGRERDHGRLGILAELLAGLNKEMPNTPWPAEVEPPHRLALSMIKNGANGIEFQELTHVLAASAKVMDADEAKAALGFLMSIANQPALILRSVKPSLEVLKAISAKLPEAEWMPVAEAIARTATDGFRNPISSYDLMCSDLENVLGILDQASAHRLARLAIQEWSGPNTVIERSSSEERQKALQPLLNRLTMEDIVAIWKDPMTHPEKRDLLLKRLSQLARREFATVWDFVAWAETNRPDLDLRSPYKPMAKEQ